MRKLRAVVRLTTSVLFSGISIAAAPIPAPLLLTTDQSQVETLAQSLLKDPAIHAAREAAVKRYQAAPPWQLEDGKKNLQGIVDETLYGVLLSVVGDPAKPKIVWTEVLPDSSARHKLRGSRYAGDSPDRAYRGVSVSPAYRYQVSGRRVGSGPLYIGLESLPPPAFWGLPPLAAIASKDIDFAADGSFTVSVDATPADGSRNHLQMPPATTMLLLRDTIPDWKNQLPNQLTIKRVDTAPAKPRSRDAMVKEAVVLMDEAITASLKYFAGIWSRNTNELNVFVRPLGWGLLCVNRFSLQDDEAMMITLDPQSARYLSIQVMDPWLRSAAYHNRTTSMNNFQAKANADGSVTYVMSLKDPGVYNWIDSGGLRDGIAVVRWELFASAANAAVAEQAVREVRKVTFSDLASALPADVVRVSAAERKQQLIDRQADYEKRVR